MSAGRHSDGDKSDGDKSKCRELKAPRGSLENAPETVENWERPEESGPCGQFVLVPVVLVPVVLLAVALLLAGADGELDADAEGLEDCDDEAEADVEAEVSGFFVFSCVADDEAVTDGEAVADLLAVSLGDWSCVG